MRSRQLPSAVAFNPDLAIMTCGGTDLQRGQRDPDTIEVELSRIISGLRGVGCDVISIGLYGAGGRARVLAERILAVSLRHGARHLDLSTHPVIADRQAWSTDGEHLNARGHAAVAATTIPWLSELTA